MVHGLNGLNGSHELLKVKVTFCSIFFQVNVPAIIAHCYIKLLSVLRINYVFLTPHT